MTYVDRIATVLIQLDEIDPPIWRRVEVPLTASLKGLHEVIQAVMPFENYHLFMFEIGDSRYGIRQPEFDDVCYVRDAKGMKLGAVVDRDTPRESTLRSSEATSFLPRGFRHHLCHHHLCHHHLCHQSRPYRRLSGL